MAAVIRAAMAVLAVVAGLVGPAAADDVARAREVATRGLAAAGEGRKSGDPAKFAEAIALFKEAFALDPDPEYQCNIGIAYRDMKDPARAHLFLGRCVARMGATPQRQAALAKVQAKIEADLRASHVPVDVVVQPAGALVRVSTFGADEEFQAPWLIWLPPGKHTLEAHATGFATGSREVEVAAGMAKQTVAITLTAELTEKVAEPVGPPAGPPDDASAALPPAVNVGAPVMEPPADEPPSDRGRRGTSLASKLLLGGGVAALAGGGVMHAITWGNIQDLEGLSGDERERKVSTIEKQRLTTFGLYAAGGVATGVGLWLFFRDRGRGRDSAVSLAPAPGGGAMVVWSGVR